MNAESDGIDEALGQSLREALQAAEKFGRGWSEGIARMREKTRQRNLEEDRRAEAEARYQKAWDKAWDKLSVAEDQKWWEQATPEQIAEVYEVAVTWREHEPAAARIDDVIYDEVLERYDHDLRTPSADQVREDLEKIEAERAEEKTEEEKDVEDVEPEKSTETGVEGEPLTPEPEREEAVEEEKPPAYDSVERREHDERTRVEKGVDPDLARTHHRVDTMNATHPRDAVDTKRAATRLAGPRGRPRARQADKDLVHR